MDKQMEEERHGIPSYLCVQFILCRIYYKRDANEINFKFCRTEFEFLKIHF